MRHPLTELPLDKFISYEQRTGTKRPISPSATLLSPSKRRILTAEGLYSPEKRRRTTSSKHPFSDHTVSPSSPARKLDFFALSHPSPRKPGFKDARNASPRPETPTSRTAAIPKLAASPEIASSSSSDASASTSTSGRPDDCVPVSDASPTCSFPLPLVIPREMPTFTDRQSIHWPGFDVHRDTHITIPAAQDVAHVSDLIDIDDAEGAKENARPRKRAGKRAASDEGKSKPVKTERQARDAGDINIMSMLTSSPGKRAMTPREKQQGRKQMRLIMELEMDEEDDVDNQL